MLVHVTQEHIDSARAQKLAARRVLPDGNVGYSVTEWDETRHCPIARALSEAGYRNPVVNGVCVLLPSGWVVLPTRAVQFLRRFDKGLAAVEPFAFHVREREDAS